MPENVQLAVVRLASMVAWMSEHSGSTVDEIAAHFHRTRRQVRRDVEYLASYGYISWSPKGVFERAYQIDKTYKDALTIKLNNIQLEIQELEEEIEGMRPRGILDIKLKLEEHKVLKLYEALLIAHIKLLETLDLSDPKVTTDEPLRNNKQ